MGQLSPAFVTTALNQMVAPAATAEMRLAREAVALAAEEQSEFTYAAFARQGAWDDDHEIRVALTAIRLAKESFK